jgi:hypothetical protein
LITKKGSWYYGDVSSDDTRTLGQGRENAISTLEDKENGLFEILKKELLGKEK